MKIRIPQVTWKYTILAYALVVGGWLVYAALTLFAPPTANMRYHLAEPELALLRLSVILPVHLIWLIAVNGAVTFKKYSILVESSKESQAYNLIAAGLLWTVAYFVVSSLISSLAPFFSDARTYDFFVVIRDHLAPLASLVAFIYIYRGSHLLRELAGFATWTRSTGLIMAIYGIFAFFFVLQFSTGPVLNSQAIGRNAAAIIPHSVLLITIITPYLVAWFIGILAAVNLTKYARRVKGVLYRKALRDLVVGICFVIIFGVTSELISFAAKYLTSLPLGPLLAIIYPLILLYGVGFIFIRSGANKLARFEATP